MGIYAPLIRKAQSTNRPNPEKKLSDNIVTPANAMTAARPLILAPKVAHMLLKGERNVTPWVLAVFLSDAEGNVARATDAIAPDLRRGSTKWGAIFDPIADTAAVLEIATATFKAPRVSKLAKTSLAITFGTELYKSGWALNSARQYKNASISDEHPHGERLFIPADDLGKEAMFEKLLSLVFATATNDLDPGPKRTAMGALAMGHAIAGARHGEQARAGYVEEFANIMSGTESPQFAS